MGRAHLTDQEKRVIKDMPTGWFKPSDLPYYYIGPNGILNRLQKKGVVDSRMTEDARKEANLFLLISRRSREENSAYGGGSGVQ